MTECRVILKEEITDVINILSQDTLRYSDGNYPNSDWIIQFFNNTRGYTLGYYEDNKLQGVVIAEQLLAGGIMLWYIAFLPEHTGLGKGKVLLSYFEDVVRKDGKEWIFLNATNESLNFYKQNGFLTSKYSTVFEHCKDL